MRDHRGMTLIEVIIALLILTVGLLGTASAAGAAARLIDDARRQSRFAAAATGLLEELRDSACNATGGTRSAPPFQFTWTVQSAAALAEVRLVGEYHTGSGTRQVAFILARWCP